MTSDLSCVLCLQVHVREAWDNLRTLFLVSDRPLPVGPLQSLVTLLSLSPLLILNLLVNFAVFFQQSLSGSTEVLQTVRKQPVPLYLTQSGHIKLDLHILFCCEKGTDASLLGKKSLIIKSPFWFLPGSHNMELIKLPAG